MRLLISAVVVLICSTVASAQELQCPTFAEGQPKIRTFQRRINDMSFFVDTGDTSLGAGILTRQGHMVAALA